MLQSQEKTKCNTSQFSLLAQGDPRARFHARQALLRTFPALRTSGEPSVSVQNLPFCDKSYKTVIFLKADFPHPLSVAVSSPVCGTGSRGKRSCHHVSSGSGRNPGSFLQAAKARLLRPSLLFRPCSRHSQGQTRKRRAEGAGTAPPLAPVLLP